MPAFKVTSSIDINVPTSRVRDAVADFNTWPIWSPWLITEPDSELSFKGSAGELGHGYDWVGEKVGAGGMVMTALDANRMESDLEFLKPWKSHADIAFDFESIGEGQTQLKWHMDSKLPFFMIFQLAKMKNMIRNDYDRGLRMLKDYLEGGSVPSVTNVEGLVDVPATTYAGKTFSSSLADIAESMTQKAFPDVCDAVVEAGAEIGAPFVIYNTMDVANSLVSYTAAVSVASSVETSNGVRCKEREACRALKIVHTGAYRHLGNAWSTGLSDLEHGKMKMDKRNPPFEIYMNDPDEVEEESLITEIYMPIRT